MNDSQDNGMQARPDLPKPKMSPAPAISRSRLDSSSPPTPVTRPVTGFRGLAPGPGRFVERLRCGSGDGTQGVTARLVPSPAIVTLLLNRKIVTLCRPALTSPCLISIFPHVFKCYTCACTPADDDRLSLYPFVSVLSFVHTTTDQALSFPRV